MAEKYLPGEPKAKTREMTWKSHKGLQHLSHVPLCSSLSVSCGQKDIFLLLCHRSPLIRYLRLFRSYVQRGGQFIGYVILLRGYRSDQRAIKMDQSWVAIVWCPHPMLDYLGWSHSSTSQPSFPPTRTLENRRQWLKEMGLCYTHLRPKWSSRLLTSGWLIPGYCEHSGFE